MRDSMKWIYGFLLVWLFFLPACDRKPTRHLGAPPPHLSPARAVTPVPDSPKMMNVGINESVAPERMIARRASVEAEVADCDSTLARLQALFISFGGFVTESRLESREQGRRQGSVTGRVPVEAFDGTLARLPALFSKVLSVQTSGTDITDEYYDTEGRLANRRALQERYRELSKRADATKDLIEIQRALADLDNEIDRLEGRRQQLSRQARMASLSIQFREPLPAVPASPLHLRETIRDGIENGLAGLGGLLGLVISVFIVLVPVALVIFVIVFVLVRAVRARRRRRATAAGPAHPTSFTGGRAGE
jgi:hypothetical protein